MARKQKTKQHEEYDFLHLEVLNYAVSSNASINHEVRDRRSQHDEAKVYEFYSDVAVTCRRIWPEERPDWEYRIHIYGQPLTYRDFDMTLKDCHVRDAENRFVYEKRSGRERPVYEAPKGLGSWEKLRGQNCMSGAIWISPKSMSDMIQILNNGQPPWVAIHERKIEKIRWIVGFTLQTEKPQ